MASAPTMSDEKSSPSNSESESDTESESSDDNDTTESLSSFDQSEEEGHISSEDIIEEPASEQLLCEFEIGEKKPSEVETTDVNSYDLERSGEAVSMSEFLSLLPFSSSSSFSSFFSPSLSIILMASDIFSSILEEKMLFFS